MILTIKQGESRTYDNDTSGNPKGVYADAKKSQYILANKKRNDKDNIHVDCCPQRNSGTLFFGIRLGETNNMGTVPIRFNTENSAACKR